MERLEIDYREQQLLAQIRMLLETTQSTHLKQRLANAGLAVHTLQSVTDLNQLPVLRKDDLRELQAADPPFGGLLGVSIDHIERIYQSPGPIYDPQGKGIDYWGWRPALEAAKFTAGDRVLVCFAYHLTPAGQMFDDGARALGCVVIPGGIGNQEQQVDLIAQLGVTAYIGLPSYLNALLERAEQAGYTKAASWALRKAYVTAEPLPPSLRQALTDRGLSVFQAYGTADLGCVAYECEAQDGLHIRADLLVDICDPTNGQPLPPEQIGEIVVTTLEPTYPLVRFGTGDLSALSTQPCACRRTTPRLLGIRGRLGQGIKVRGLFVYPHQLRTALADLPGVTAFSGCITRHNHRDQLAVELELADDAPNNLLEQASQRLQNVLKLRCDVRAVAPGALSDLPMLRDERVWE